MTMTRSFKLRAPEPDDVNMIYIWENLSDESHSSLRSGPLSRHQIQQFVDNYDGEIYSQGALRYMIDVDGQTVGTIDVFDYDHRARHAFIGIYVSAAARRNGVGCKAIAEVERLMARNVGMHSLAALVAEDNLPSRKLFEKAGYKAVGILRDWLTDGEKRINAIVYQHLLTQSS